jgi:hypothetical protein
MNACFIAHEAPTAFIPPRFAVLRSEVTLGKQSIVRGDAMEGFAVAQSKHARAVVGMAMLEPSRNHGRSQCRRASI